MPSKFVTFAREWEPYLKARVGWTVYWNDMNGKKKGILKSVVVDSVKKTIKLYCLEKGNDFPSIAYIDAVTDIFQHGGPDAK